MNLTQDPFLHSLIARLHQPGVIGFAVTGSYARGENQTHSDVDLDIFVEELPSEAYTLRFFNGKLVSLKYILLRDEYDSLTKPETAIWAVPGLSQMRILQDDTGQIAKLKQAALEFKWTVLQDSANEYASKKLMGCAEEAHKIVSGLNQNHESKVLYAAWGMFKELSFAVVVQAGLMINSENRAFDVLQEHLGRDYAWTRAFRLSFGMDVGDAQIPAYQTRGKAALELYAQTAVLFKDIIKDEHREVITNTLQLISSYE
ncbi:MAG: nucleotidyltransferase domain-containing protein [Anaerolineales bacterium]